MNWTVSLPFVQCWCCNGVPIPGNVYVFGFICILEYCKVTICYLTHGCMFATSIHFECHIYGKCTKDKGECCVIRLETVRCILNY